MRIMNISFFFTEIGREKGKIQIFHIIFLNKDISITVPDIALKCCMSALHICSEGRVSQIFYLGLSVFFM